MRVGLSTTMIEPQLTHGRLDGIGVYTRALQQHLPASGCQVQGFSFPPLLRQATLSAGQAFAHSYEMTSLRDLATLMRSTMPMDVFHATDYRIVRMDCPVVATLHDAVPIKFPHWCTPRLRGLKNWLQKKAAKKADRVIALSHYAVTELVECFGVQQDRISVVYCGVAEEWKQPVADEAVAATLAQYGLQAGYFLFVGTLQPRKNVERILQAYLTLPAEVRQAHALVVVGRAGWQCEELVRQLQAAQQNRANVLWLNAVADMQQLRHLYAGAGVFVFPSLYEGFGIPVVEAFAAGVPVITSNTTSLPEVSQGAALEVDPLSLDEISAAMLSLVRDDSVRLACIEKGWQRVAQLSWQQTAAQTAAVYRLAMTGRG
jgi:alpha-1,3-rhamnosyl/mannosyltransferase